MNSRVVRKPCYGISEVCTRWSVTELDVANFAIGRELTLSVVAARLPVEEGEVDEVDDGHFVDIPEGRRWFSGTLELWPQDAWQVVMDGSAGVSSFQAGPGRYRRVSSSTESAEFVVPRERLVVQHAELERFEAAQAASVAVAELPHTPMLVAAVRGAPARYDWDEFWCEVAVMLQVEGMPETQAALVRRMTGWFFTRGHCPDQSTIKKKVSLLWRRHSEALARETA